MTTWCCQVVHTSTTGRRHQTCLHSQMTPPASPTLTFPTNTLWKTSTWASLALYSSVSLVRNRLSPFSPSPCPCTFVFVSLKLAMFCSLKRQSRWVGEANWRSPWVRLPLWGFWWEREQVQTKQPCLRHSHQIHNQWVCRGITAKWVRFTSIFFHHSNAMCCCTLTSACTQRRYNSTIAFFPYFYFITLLHF